MSDLHGCYEKYITMIETIKMTDDNELHILGDIVDRSEGGIAILQDLMKRKNVTVLRGNHDQDAMVYLKTFGCQMMDMVQMSCCYHFSCGLLMAVCTPTKASLSCRRSIEEE